MRDDPAKILKTKRAELGLTQTEFAERLGVTLRSVQFWEAGERNPSKSILKLAATLDPMPAERKKP